MNPGHTMSWGLAPPAATIQPGAAPNPPIPSQLSYLGHGLNTPFTRTANDFNDAEDLANVKSAITQILGTKAQGAQSHGELPWRTEFGSLLHLLRHRNQTAGFRMFALHYAREALTRWEPRVRVIDVELLRSATLPTVVTVRVAFHVLDRNVASNRVIFPNQTVDLPFAG